MAFTPLTKTTAQQAPYAYFWLPDSTGVNVWKYMGTTRVEFRGGDDNDATAKINGHEAHLDSKGKPVHG